MDVVRVGVVGADPRGFAARAHLPAVINSPRLELAAICTAHEETARAAAQAYGAAKWYADIADLVGDPDIDLVIISVRPRFHQHIAQASLEAGKMTYCEWPLGRITREASQMAILAARTGTPSAVGLQGRFSPAIDALRKQVLAGKIGHPLTADVSLLQAPFRVDSDRSWLIEKDEASGALHVATAHVTDALQFVLEDLVAVSGIAATLVEEGRYADTDERFVSRTYDTVLFLAETASGVAVSARISNVTRPPLGFTLRITGEDGHLMARAPEYFQFSPVELLVGSGDCKPERIDIKSPDGRDESDPASNVARAIEAFVGARTQPVNHVPDFAEGLALHHVIDAIAEVFSVEAVGEDTTSVSQVSTGKCWTAALARFQPSSMCSIRISRALRRSPDTMQFTISA